VEHTGLFWSDNTESDTVVGVGGQNAVPTVPVLSNWSIVSLLRTTKILL